MVASGTAAKPKVETKPANIVEKVVMEKKPPLPTVNRAAEKTHNKLTSLKYVPPRNKNEVTGKVTENLIQSKDKVFRPNRSSDSLTKNTDSNSK